MFVIAEIGTAHAGSFNAACKLIDAARDAGADAVKLQWVYADENLHPAAGLVELPGGAVPLYERFRALEVPPDFFARAQAYARDVGMQFICSPFGLKSLREMLALRPDAVKIASPELNHIPLLTALAAHRRVQRERGSPPIPVILSSGVSRLADIETALDIVGTDDVTVLHCVTSYPAPEDEYNVRTVETLRNTFGVATGISDHSLDPVLVPALAAAAGSTMTEKHITLSKNGGGLDDPIALEKDAFTQMVYVLRQCDAAIKRYGTEQGAAIIRSELSEQYGKEKVERVLGTGMKQLADAERENYGRTNRSLHFMRALPAGAVIAPQDVAVLRTEKNLSPGIAPCFLTTVIGAQLTRAVTDGAGVQWEDVIARKSTAHTDGTACKHR